MTDLKPCAHCGNTDLSENLWSLDSGEVDAIECNQCFAGAPLEAWNRRPDPWRYPPALPAQGERVLLTYMHPETGESTPITAKNVNPENLHPIVRWMPIPAV